MMHLISWDDVLRFKGKYSEGLPPKKQIDKLNVKKPLLLL